MESKGYPKTIKLNAKWYSPSQVWPQFMCLTHSWPQHLLYLGMYLYFTFSMFKVAGLPPPPIFSPFPLYGIICMWYMGKIMEIPLKDILCIYSLFQKKHIFISKFLWDPSGGGGPKIHMVDCVNGSFIYIIDHVIFWPLPQGGYKKIWN